MCPPQPEQAKLSSRSDERRRPVKSRRRAGHHRRALDRPPDRDRVHRGSRASGRNARRLRRARSRHRDARDRRPRPPSPRGTHRCRAAHRRLGIRPGRRGRGDALAEGARPRVPGRADGSGRILAGAGGADGKLVDALAYLAQGGAPFGALSRSTGGAGAGRNTTLAVVATNAQLDRVALQSLAHAAGDALARRIVPYGTAFDGDVVFAVSTAAVTAATQLQVEALAALAVPEAVERAVRLARGMRDIPGLA